MSRKRDFIKEILSKKRRHHGDKDRIAHFFSRFSPLEVCLRHLENDSVEEEIKFELLKYIPIGIVACIEGYFRFVIRDLIDYGSPFRENGDKFKDIKFDETAFANQDISKGEFISHRVTLSNLDHLKKSMETLIGYSFEAKLAHTKYNDFGYQSSQITTLDERAGLLYEKIKNLFEKRHIYCHELAPLEQIKIDEIETYFDAALEFVYVTEFLVMELLDKPLFFDDYYSKS